MTDEGKVKLLPIFRSSSQVTKIKSKAKGPLLTTDLVEDEDDDEPHISCKYTCDNWPYKVCKV